MNRKTKIEQVGGGSNSVPFPLPGGISLDSNLVWSSRTETPLEGNDFLEQPMLIVPLVLGGEVFALSALWHGARALGGAAAAVFAFIVTQTQLDYLQQLSQPCEA